MEIGRILGATRVLGKSQGYLGLPIRDDAKVLGELPHMLETFHDSRVTGGQHADDGNSLVPKPRRNR